MRVVADDTLDRLDRNCDSGFDCFRSRGSPPPPPLEVGLALPEVEDGNETRVNWSAAIGVPRRRGVVGTEGASEVWSE